MSPSALKAVSGLLCDLNGVVYEGDHPIEGAIDAINHLKSKSIPIRFTTNTTTCSAATLHQKLSAMGLPIEIDEIFGVTRAAASYLRNKGRPSLFLITDEDTAKDFADFPVTENKPDFIVIGEIGDRWTYELIHKAFHMMLDGAELLALHKSKFWQVEGTLRLSVGAFATALEYATSTNAIVIGKPEKAFYQAALEELGLPADQVAMIGDDIDSDVGGAQRVGMKGILVKTGKYREELVARSQVKPDLIIESLAALIDLL